MRKIFLLLVLFSTLVTHAQSPFAKVDEWLDRYTPQMGGRSVLLVYKDGKLLHSRTENGLSPRQERVARLIARRQGKEANLDDFAPDTKQLIASCSKWLSAALVMTYVDEGKLRLTDTVGRWLPALSASGKGGISIAQCLSHTTGIRAPDLREDLQERKRAASMDEEVKRIAALPVEGAPGTVFRYSSVGLQIAGSVLEKIGGKPFATLFSERIAAPLSLRNTDWGGTAVVLPAGGARSSAEDYLRFLQMILNKGTFEGKRVLSAESVAAMQVNRIGPGVRVAYAPAEAGNFGYGFGEWVMASSGGKGSAVSSPGLFGTFPFVDNERGYCAILLTFYLKSEGRHERYKELKALLDEAVH